MTPTRTNPLSSCCAVNRRGFLRTSVTLGAGAALGVHYLTAAERARSIGANDRIRIGIIGCGDRGCPAHIQGIYKRPASTRGPTHCRFEN